MTVQSKKSANFFTITALTRHSIEVKKSRFDVVTAPIENSDQAMTFFAAHGDASASHCCWAYRHGHQYRFNDDGEPSGTAGKPILQAIDGQQLDAVAVLVIRWFGGIKLGAGGLVRAYGGAAAQCLRLATRIERVNKRQLQIKFPFAYSAAIYASFNSFQGEKIKEQFAPDGCILDVLLPSSLAEAFVVEIGNISRGQAHITFT